MGSGMAFPREVIGKVNLATGHLAADLDLGLQSAVAGYAPLFCPAAVVRSEFPSTGLAAVAQRQRWEHRPFERPCNQGGPLYLGGSP